MRHRARTRRRLLATFVAGAIAASGCAGGATYRSPSRSALEAAASALRWPGTAPSGAALERFAAPSVPAEPTAVEIAERANMCEWYAHWLAVTRGEATGDRAEIEADLSGVIPDFTWVTSGNATPWALQVAQSAARGDESYVVAFLDANDCESRG